MKTKKTKAQQKIQLELQRKMTQQREREFIESPEGIKTTKLFSLQYLLYMVIALSITDMEELLLDNGRAPTKLQAKFKPMVKAQEDFFKCYQSIIKDEQFLRVCENAEEIKNQFYRIYGINE